MRKPRDLAGVALGVMASFLMAVSAQAQKRDDIPGYVFEQLTDNAATDWLPRVSSQGLTTWVGRYALPGSTGGSAR